MKPSIGRIVHYVSYGTPGGEYSRECRAAVITEVNRYPEASIGDHADEIGLFVMNPTGFFLNRNVPLAEGKQQDIEPAGLCGGLDYPGGTWHWPAIVREPGDRPPRY